eukprot:463687-Prymnesium_polylepis.1
MAFSLGNVRSVLERRLTIHCAPPYGSIWRGTTRCQKFTWAKRMTDRVSRQAPLNRGTRPNARMMAADPNTASQVYDGPDELTKPHRSKNICIHDTPRWEALIPVTQAGKATAATAHRPARLGAQLGPQAEAVSVGEWMGWVGGLVWFYPGQWLSSIRLDIS